jgi:gluconokinase
LYQAIPGRPREAAYGRTVTRVVVMGMAGAGKSAVGAALADRLGVPHVDGDDLHTVEDRAAMASGQAIADDHRDQWIERVRSTLLEHTDVVVSCSALRRVHRDRLTAVPGVRAFFLVAPEVELRRRLETRSGHFFPASALATQLAALEPVAPDESVVVVDATPPVGSVVDRIVSLGPRSRPR